MSALSIQVPFPVFQDRDGQPLENGYIWLGEANLNPQTNPVVAYYDDALTIVAAQPLRTINGYVSRSGTPAQIYVDGVNFSILVQDNKGTMVYNIQEGTGISPNASGIVYDPAGTGAVATTVQTKLRESVSVKDYLPVGYVIDGSVDYSSAVSYAIVHAATSGQKVIFPGFPLKFTVSTTNAVEIECEPGFVALAAATGDIACLKFNGVASSTNYQLSGAIVRGAKSITMTASVSDISAGDFFILQDDTARTSDGAKKINMEVHQAQSVVGSTITLNDFVREAKAVTTTNVYKITMCENPIIRGWKYEGLTGTTANSGLFFDMCYKPRVHGFIGTNGVGDAVSFRRCFDVLIDDWDVSSPQLTGSGQGYGPSFAQGTTKIYLGSGIGRGMRHTVDFDSCWDVASDWFDSVDCATTADVMVSHNGWGGDFQDLKIRVRAGKWQSAYIAAPADSSSIYAKPLHNMNITIDSELSLSSGAYGFYSEQPIVDSNINVLTLHGDGSKPTSYLSNTAAVRIPPSDSKGTKITVNATGAILAVARIGTSTTNLGDAVFDVTARNCYQAALVQNSPELNIDNLDADNIHAQVLQYDGVNTLKKIDVACVNLKNITAALTSIPAARISSNGAKGRFCPVFSDASGVPVTLGAGFQVTTDQILKAQDGETVLVTAAGAVTSNATAFEQGFFTGQKLTLVTDQNANTITIQHSTQVQNDGAVSVVLGSAKRSATWIYNSYLGRWYQAA